MNELRNDLKRLVESNQLLSSVLPMSFVLVLLYPVLYLISTFAYFPVYSVISSVWFLLFLVGMTLCFAEGIDWALGTAFAILALRWFISMIKNFRFNALVFLAFYVCLAVLFFRSLTESGAGNRGSARMPERNAHRIGNDFVQPAGGQNYDSPFCSGCGKPVDPSGNFCPFCGTPYPNNARPSQPAGGFSTAPTEKQPGNRRRYSGYSGYGGTTGMVAEMCGSVAALAFDILITIHTVLALIANFSVGTLVIQAPMILICVGCWLLYAGAMNHQLQPTGFTILSGVMICYLVLSYLACLLLVVVSFYCFSTGDSDAATVGMSLLVMAIVIAVFATFYWKGLRRSAVSARAILRGEEYEWKTSLFAIVILCISAASKLISFLAMLGVRASLNSIVREISSELYYMTGSSELSNAFGNMISSSLGGNSGLSTVNSLLSIAVPVYAVVLLFLLRGKNKVGTR